MTTFVRPRRIMAVPCNLAIGALRLAHRHYRSHPVGRTVHGPALAILGLTS